MEVANNLEPVATVVVRLYSNGYSHTVTDIPVGPQSEALYRRAFNGLKQFIESRMTGKGSGNVYDKNLH